MTKIQRILATLRCEETDRVPFGLWQHSTVHERTVENFTRFTLDFYNRYDPDFVKVMYDENYDTPPGFEYVGSVEQWEELEEFDHHIGAFGRQLEVLKRVKDTVGADVPVVQTIYSPFHVGHRLAGRRIMADLKTEPDSVRAGLEAIASNYGRFAASCLTEAGIDGFFFAAFGCERDWMSLEEYRRWVMPTDRKVLQALRSASLVMLHVHGEGDTYFRELCDYDCDAVSWEDRVAGPGVAEAKTITDKALIGGVNHVTARSGPATDVEREAREAIELTGARGLILAPGCTFFNETPEENLQALKKVVTQGAG